MKLTDLKCTATLAIVAAFVFGSITAAAVQFGALYFTAKYMNQETKAKVATFYHMDDGFEAAFYLMIIYSMIAGFIITAASVPSLAGWIARNAPKDENSRS